MRAHPNDKQFNILDGQVFVFGSNLAGIHGAGAARFAWERLGAIMGTGQGLMDRSYAIPTKDENLATLPLDVIRDFVTAFVAFARCHTDLRFFVTRIGCGLAGFSDHEIAPLFKEAPPNCELPLGWDNPETL